MGLFTPTALPNNLPPGYRASIETWRARIIACAEIP
jgi:hypothetical protein